jgi:serine/threonine protein phosphatase PrpC
VTSDPEIIEKTLDAEDEYLVIATDGLWDVLEGDDVAKVVLSCRSEFLHVSKKLCLQALSLGSADNITVLVIDLK